MKKTLRSLALLLVAVTLASSAVSAAAPSSIWKKATPSLICEECKCKKCICEEEKSVLESAGKNQYVVTADGTVLKPASSENYPLEDGTVLVESGVKLPTLPSKPSVKPVKPSAGTIISGGKYYPFGDSKLELGKYFEQNTYTMSMFAGQTRALATDAYLYTSDESVAYYDYANDCIVAKRPGDVYLYAYTKGGVPFFRLELEIYPNYIPGLKKADQLKVVTKDNVSTITPGASLALSVVSLDGVKYTDMEYLVMNDNAEGVTIKDGVFTAKNAGAFLVRAYSKSNTKVYGDILILVSTYHSSILENGWKPSMGGIVVDKWYGSIFENYQNWYVSGWIQSAEGIFIPVVKYEDITVVDDDGNKTTVTIAKEEVKSYLQLLKDVYGEELSMKEIFKYYAAIVNNPFKGMTEQEITKQIVDYKVAMFDRLLNGLVK